MTYRAVIFDLDGTLLDTLEDIADSANSVLRQYGYPEHEHDAYRYFIGEGMEKLIRRVLPGPDPAPELVAQCLRAMRTVYNSRWSNHSRPYAGIPELLSALTVRGIKRAVLSNKPDDFTKMMVASLLPACHFDEIVGSTPSVPAQSPRGSVLTLPNLFSLETPGWTWKPQWLQACAP
jgi:phosphoglycolate phosphatase